MRSKMNPVSIMAALVVMAACVAGLSQTAWADGACCLSDGTCQSISEMSCEAQDGYFWGDDVLCSDPGVSCVGACATTDFLSFDPGCFVGSVDDCSEAIGYFVGFGTTCADDVWAEHPYIYPNGGQINISGASLFADFFAFPAATNDFINVDGDYTPCAGDVPFAGFSDTNCDGWNDGVDQLAPSWQCSGWNGHWLVQYRSVGSGNGLAEFVDYQLLGLLPTTVPTEKGLINRTVWAQEGSIIDVGCMADCYPNDRADLNCDDVVDGLDLAAFVLALVDGQAAYEAAYPACPGLGTDDSSYFRADFTGDDVVDIADVEDFLACALEGGCEISETGTPVCPTSIDIANMDVATKWFTRTGDSSTAAWNQVPTVAGYGQNPITSADVGYSNKLKSLERGSVTLNVNTDPPVTPDPDGETVYDTTIAYSPVSIIASRGTGLEDISYSQMQYLFVTGRMPSGENLAAVTRDAGSGTRNAAMNSLGIDPSWGMGDNLGRKTDNTALTNLGPDTQHTMCGGSSMLENAVQYRRLAVGYTGLFGSSRSAADAAGGKYEILNVIKDTAGGTIAVRPSVTTVLYNEDIDSGWQIGGSQTFATRGDPMSDGGVGANPTMDNLAARDYIRNLLASIAAFVANPGGDPDFFMPAELLTQTFVLDAAVPYLPLLTDPDNYQPNPGFNANVQTAVEAAQTTVVPAFGSVYPTSGLYIPKRNNGTYDDGCANNYADYECECTLSSGVRVFPCMKVHGDWNGDGTRTVDDIQIMMVAYYLKTTEGPCAFAGYMVNNDWPAALLAACPALATLPNGDMGNYIVPEIMGDYDFDGNFTDLDIRYFADGLALVGGQLDRQAGFEAVDTAWLSLTGTDDNFFDTLVSGAYAIGDSRFDVAGASASRGAAPTGADGRVDASDVQYITDNSFSEPWGAKVGLENAYLHLHATRDLSCDMDGDLDVDAVDAAAAQAKAL